MQPRWGSVAFVTTFYNEASIVSEDVFWLIVAQSLLQTSIKKDVVERQVKIVTIAIV